MVSLWNDEYTHNHKGWRLNLVQGVFTIVTRYAMACNLNPYAMIVIITSVWWLLMAWGRFKNAYELLNLRALKISMLHKKCIFQIMGKIFCLEFQRKGYLWNSAQNILHINWKICISFTGENLRALTFKSSCDATIYSRRNCFSGNCSSSKGVDLEDLGRGKGVLVKPLI